MTGAREILTLGCTKTTHIHTLCTHLLWHQNPGTKRFVCNIICSVALPPAVPISLAVFNLECNRASQILEEGERERSVL